MKYIQIILVFVALLLTCPSVNGQDFLQKARNYLDAGECEKAQRAYDAYKVEHPSGNTEVERRIADCGKIRQIEERVQEFSIEGVSFRIMPVQGGTFKMGSGVSIHAVTLSGFYMGETEITQGLWKAVMGTTLREQRDKYNPNYTLCGEGTNYPMYYVTYKEAKNFCSKLNKLLVNQLPSGFFFDLPTEAEWEYAARGGNKSKGFIYSGSNNIDEVAWYIILNEDNVIIGGNSKAKTWPVKSLKSNELGLYDMSGNVCEWCCDYYQEKYYEMSASFNPQCQIPDEESRRVFRGGCWALDASHSEVDIRYAATPPTCGNGFGFRIALVQR